MRTSENKSPSPSCLEQRCVWFGHFGTSPFRTGFSHPGLSPCVPEFSHLHRPGDNPVPVPAGTACSAPRQRQAGGGALTEVALGQQRIFSETPERERAHSSQEERPLRAPELREVPLLSRTLSVACADTSSRNGGNRCEIKAWCVKMIRFPLVAQETTVPVLALPSTLFNWDNIYITSWVTLGWFLGSCPLRTCLIMEVSWLQLLGSRSEQRVLSGSRLPMRQAGASSLMAV